ncbi:unnamed protein product [Cylicocyclus nassatus]|uniref:Uncharacterized protein n=1 Tax=Cylicocyclus nassatus TaxID=53992 RepID=A0AA36GZ37_CYLNA|nr:unnamed protein product [Cylicocyclus nassatus]
MRKYLALASILATNAMPWSDSDESSYSQENNTDPNSSGFRWRRMGGPLGGLGGGGQVGPGSPAPVPGGPLGPGGPPVGGAGPAPMGINVGPSGPLGGLGNPGMMGGAMSATDKPYTCPLSRTCASGRPVQSAVPVPSEDPKESISSSSPASSNRSLPCARSSTVPSSVR